MRKSLFLILVMLALLLSACGEADKIENNEGGPDNRIVESTGQVEDALRGDEPTTENAGVIRAAISRNCNYVYHMMAVSGCGYVNEYGNKYKHLHPEADLQVLKQNEQHLTIKGGEYQGDLNFLFMILPASLDDEIPVTLYFEALADLFDTGEVERNFETYQEIYKLTFSSVTEVSLDSNQAFYEYNERYKNEIAEIATVMCSNYSIYMDNVWEESLAELSVAADELNKIFADRDLASKWEAELGHQYRHDAFYALLCNSMDNGPDCIDVSDYKDVFNANGDYEITAHRISHEFGIYLLMDILPDSEYRGYDYWGLKEGLAEYYNIVVSGGFPNWIGGEEYIDFYSRLGENHPGITAREMFLQAVDFYMPVS